MWMKQYAKVNCMIYIYQLNKPINWNECKQLWLTKYFVTRNSGLLHMDSNESVTHFSESVLSDSPCEGSSSQKYTAWFTWTIGRNQLTKMSFQSKQLLITKYFATTNSGLLLNQWLILVNRFFRRAHVKGAHCLIYTNHLTN